MVQLDYIHSLYGHHAVQLDHTIIQSHSQLGLIVELEDFRLARLYAIEMVEEDQKWKRKNRCWESIS